MHIEIVVQSIQDKKFNTMEKIGGQVHAIIIIRLGSLQESLNSIHKPVFLETNNLSLHYGRCKIYRLYIGTYKFMFFVIVIYRAA